MRGKRETKVFSKMEELYSRRKYIREIRKYKRLSRRV